MRFVSEHFDPFGGFMRPNSFRRSPFRQLRPVPGGRWMVRKIVDEKGDGLTWRAWSNGKARPYARNFATVEEAVAWAQSIALTFKVGDPDTRAALRQELNDSRRNRAEGALDG